MGAKAPLKMQTINLIFPQFQDIVWDFQLGKELHNIENYHYLILDFGVFIIVLAF